MSMHDHHHQNCGHANTGSVGEAPHLAKVPDDTIYTCPMHPEIRQSGPGHCPICGMALEPEVASAESGPNPELADMTRRFWIGLALSLPVVVLEMGGHLFNLHMLIGQKTANWVQLFLATPVVLWAGWPFFERGAKSLVTRKLNMFTLIALGTGVAWLYSVVATLAPGLFPQAFRGADGSVAIYFEAASVITVLVLLGQVLELRAREQTSNAIKALLDLAPKTARRIRGDSTDEEVPLDRIAVGDRLRVRPGEKVPVDGVILEGCVSIDESMVTGESMPASKEAGAKVIAGTLNRSGSFVMRAEKVGADTLLSQIVQLVAKAQRSRAPIQRLADQVASWFVPLVIGVAMLAFAAWALLGPEPRLAYGIVAAVSVLIIACPCALGLATPMSIMVGVGRGARSGVLIKNAEALERMEKIDTVVIDKTGTLTEGKPKVTSVWTRGDFGEDELLRLAASLERAIEHPLASAIVEAAKERTLELSEPSGIEAPAGKGVLGTIEGHKLTIAMPTSSNPVVSRRPSSPSKRMNYAPKAPRSFLSASMARPTGSWRLPIPSSRRRLLPSRRCKAKACASSCSLATIRPPRRQSRAGLASTMSWPTFCPRKRAPWSNNCARKAVSLRWLVMASTMLRRSPRPMSASP